MGKVSLAQMTRIVAHVDDLCQDLLDKCERNDFPDFLSAIVKESILKGELEKLLIENLERQCSPDDIAFLYERMTSEDGKREAKIMKTLGPSMEETIKVWRASLQRTLTAGSMTGLIKTLRDLGMPEELADKLEQSGKAIIMSVEPGENIQDKVDQMIQSGELDEIIDPCDNPNCEIHGKKAKDPDVPDKKPVRKIDPSAFGM